ncbi:MAG: VWA domain-containing protein [Pseudomonadales bacterium]|nr:VWA domain-containing protein [Pseudomonadales bacterium]
MQSSLVSFIQVLRTHDVRVSPAETLDAMAVATTLGYTNRNVLRDGLAMTLAKTPEEEAIFLSCFDRYYYQQLSDFSRQDAANGEHPDAGSQSADDGDGPNQQADAVAELSPLAFEAADDAAVAELLTSPLMQSLIDNDRNELTMAIGRAAEQVGLRQIQLFTQKGQFTRKILDAMGEEQLRDAVIELERRQSPALAELQRYRDILREEVRAYVEREYLLHAEGKTRQFMDEVLSKTRLNNIEHLYLHKVHDLVRKMAKKLASRHSRKRRQLKRGQLNMAKTIRKGIVTDGVLFNTYWRRVRKEKPQILAVCDVSGSVAAYAKFLLLFLYSLQDVLPKVRSFAFSSHLGEVSSYFDEHPVEKAIELVNWKYGGATDYGSSLQDFARLALDDINSNTTVIILGDARNNNGDPKLEIMQSIYQRARQVLWLNPESRRIWGSGDSEMLRYQSACHFSAECNNLKQLERIVDQLLKSTS